MFSSLKRALWRLVRPLFGNPPPEPPFDPYAGVRVPRNGRPGDRHAAVALAEPEDAAVVNASTGRKIG